MAISISISITQNSQNIPNNKSNVTVKVNASWNGGSYNQLQKSGYLIIDGTKYTFTSSFNYNRATSGSQTLFTKTVDIAHGSDGKKTLSCSASYTSGVSSGTVTASASKALTTIPRKSTLAASNGTLATALTLTITKQATSFTHTITYKCGTASGTICTKSSNTSVAWNTSNGNTLELARQNTTGATVSVTFTIETFNGSTSVGTNTKTVTMTIPASVKPSLSVSTADDAGYYGMFGAYVQGLSKLGVSLNASGSYGSTIKAYNTTLDGVTYTTSNFVAETFRNSGTFALTATVTDSRGRTVTSTTQISVLAYTLPYIESLSVKRCTADGTESTSGGYIAVKFTASVEPLSYNNTATYTVKYKKVAEEDYTEVELGEYYNYYSVTDGLYIFQADTSASYNVTFAVTDSLTSTPKTAVASSGKKLFSIFKNGHGFALGKIAELPIFDVGFKTRFTGGILHPTLEPDTDLNDVKTPNTYVGANISSHNYANCPFDSGTFTLTVEGAGEEGQVKQILTRCSKTEPNRYIRFFFQGEWGEWCTDEPAIVYVQETGTDLNDYVMTGKYYFNSSHTPTNIPSGCINGWLIVLRADSGAIKQIWLRYGSQNTNDFNTYIRTGNGTTWSDWKRLAAEPVVLFSGNTDGTVTLSETSANFEYLEIFFTDNNGKSGGYLKIYSPNGKDVMLSHIETGSVNTYIRRTLYTISATKITPNTTARGYFLLNSNGTMSAAQDKNYIKIIRVLGHRA